MHDLHDLTEKSDLRRMGAALSKNPELVNRADGNGSTALHLAVLRGDRDAAWLLINRGADVMAKNRDGLTPIDIATSQGQDEIVLLLRARRTDNSQRATRQPAVAIVKCPVCSSTVSLARSIGKCTNCDRWLMTQEATRYARAILYGLIVVLIVMLLGGWDGVVRFVQGLVDFWRAPIGFKPHEPF